MPIEPPGAGGGGKGQDQKKCTVLPPLPFLTPKLNEAAQGAKPKKQPIDGFPPPPHPTISCLDPTSPVSPGLFPSEQRGECLVNTGQILPPLTPKPSIAPISLKMEAKSRWWSLSPRMSSPPTRFPPPLVLLLQCTGLIARSCLRAFALTVSLPRTPSSGSPQHPLPHFIQASAQTSLPLKGFS